MASDEEVASAVAFAFSELKSVVEPGGAVALAALMTGKDRCHEKAAVAGPFRRQCLSGSFSRLVADVLFAAFPVTRRLQA